VPVGALITQNNGTSINVQFTNAFVSNGAIKVRANNNCSSSAFSVLQIDPMPPQPAVIYGPVSVCKSQANVVYSIDPVPGTTYYTWTVSNGAKIIGPNTGTSVTIRFTTATSNSVSISVKTNNDCGCSEKTFLAVNVDQNCRLNTTTYDDNSHPINVYPNPAIGQTTLSFESAEAKQFHLTLSDALGNKVMNESFEALVGENLKLVDLNGLSKGIYILKLESNGRKPETIRITVQ
jgi:hypothetical protein